MSTFMDRVHTLQWDDHRYYHQSRINQTLHLVSALSFLTAYALLFVDPAAAGMVGWLFGTSFSSRVALTPSTAYPTPTKRLSRSATTCAERQF